jgi:hypothetical protein
MSNTDPQLTSATGYNVNRMTFSKPQIGNIPNQKMTYKRINISTRYPDGGCGDLILGTEKCFSFGVSPNKDDKDNINGYTLPLCLWTKDAATEAEQEWVKTFDAIVEKCKDHILDVKDELEKYDLERSMLKTLNPLYWKREKGKIVEGVGPTLYPKLIQSKKLDKITTVFDDEKGNTVDPLALIGKYCYVKAAVKIESIYISGTKIALQIKLYNAVVSLIDSGIKRLLRPSVERTVMVDDGSNVNPLSSSSFISSRSQEVEVEDEVEETGSIKGSDDEVDEDQPDPEPEPEVKKVVKKTIVKKVVKKPTA